MKPGLKSTELYVTAATALLVALNNKLELGISPEGIAALAALAAVYVVSRWRLKRGAQALGIALVAMMATGCVSYTRSSPDGTKIHATGFFQKVASIEVSEPSTNGVRTLSVKELDTNAQALEAVAKGIAEGLAKGATSAVVPAAASQTIPPNLSYAAPGITMESRPVLGTPIPGSYFHYNQFTNTEPK